MCKSINVPKTMQTRLIDCDKDGGDGRRHRRRRRVCIFWSFNINCSILVMQKAIGCLSQK